MNRKWIIKIFNKSLFYFIKYISPGSVLTDQEFVTISIIKKILESVKKLGKEQILEQNRFQIQYTAKQIREFVTKTFTKVLRVSQIEKIRDTIKSKIEKRDLKAKLKQADNLEKNLAGKKNIKEKIKIMNKLNLNFKKIFNKIFKNIKLYFKQKKNKKKNILKILIFICLLSVLLAFPAICLAKKKQIFIFKNNKLIEVDSCLNPIKVKLNFLHKVLIFNIGMIRSMLDSKSFLTQYEGKVMSDVFKRRFFTL